MNRFVRRCIRCLVILVGFFVLLGAVGWFGLRMFSPKLALLYPAIQQAVDTAAPGWEATFESVGIDWVNQWFIPAIEVTGLRMGRRASEPAIRLPRLLLVFDIGDLVHGKVSPVALEADDLDLILGRLAKPSSQADTRRPESGAAALSAPEADDAPPSAPSSSEFPVLNLRHRLRKTADTLARDLPLRKLRMEQVRIYRAPDDSDPLTFPLVQGRLNREPEKVTISLVLQSKDNTDTGQASVTVHLPRAADGTAEAILSLETIRPGRLAGLHPRLSPLAGVDLPVSGTVRGIWPPNEAPRIPEFRFTAAGGRIDRPDLWEFPLAPRQLLLDATLSTGLERLELEEAVLDFGGPVFRISGQVGRFPRPKTWKLDATIDQFAVDEVARYWPTPLLPHTREWLVNHLGEGTVDGGTFAVRIQPADLESRPLPAEAIAAELPFENLRLTYLSSMAPVRELSGTARFTARDMQFHIAGGATYDSTVPDAEVRIAPLGTPDQPPAIDIHASVNGPADDLPRAVADLFRREGPLFRFQKGTAETSLRFAFPLIGFRPEKLRWSGTSEAQNLMSPDMGPFTVELDRLTAEVAESGDIQLRAEDGTLQRAGYFREPIALSSVAASGRLPQGQDVAIPATLHADVAGVTIQADGEIAPGADPITFDLNLKMDRVPLKTALACWPTPVVPGVRNWVDAHLADGAITEARVRIDLEADHQERRRLPLTSVEALLPFEEFRLTGLPGGLPVVSDLAGTARFTARELAIDVAGGSISQTAVESGTVRVTGLDGRARPRLQTDITLRGPLDDLRTTALDFLNQKPDAVPAVTPADTSTRTKVVLALPLPETPPEKTDREPADSATTPEEVAAPAETGADGETGGTETAASPGDEAPTVSNAPSETKSSSVAAWEGSENTDASGDEAVANEKKTDSAAEKEPASAGSDAASDAPRVTVSIKPSQPVQMGAIPLSKLQMDVQWGDGPPVVGGFLVSNDTRITMAPLPTDQWGTAGVRLRADLSEAELSRIGPADLVRIHGRAPTTLQLSPGDSGLAFQLQADLARAGMELPLIGWKKAVGVSGGLDVRGTFEREKGRLSFSDIRLAGTGFQVNGAGHWSLDGPGLGFDLDPLRLDPQRLRLHVERDADGLRLQISGTQADIGPALARLRSGKGKSTGETAPPEKGGPKPDTASEEGSTETDAPSSRPPAITAEVNLDRLRLAEEAALRNLTGTVRISGRKLRSAELKGAQGKDAAVSLSLAENGILSLHVDDAGALLRGLHLSRQIKNGVLDLTAELPASGRLEPPIQGHLTLREPTVVGAPWLVRLLSAASLVGILNEMREGGIGFSVVETGFQYRRNVVALSKGRAEGFALGLTADGQINLKGMTAELEGRVVPFNVVNKFFGAIPLVGKLVGKGIIAADYRLAGPLNDPNVEIQPLSTLPIGALREIFQNIELEPPADSASKLRHRNPGLSHK